MTVGSNTEGQREFISDEDRRRRDTFCYFTIRRGKQRRSTSVITTIAGGV